jgi:uncharacterized membrane protein
MSKIEKNSLWLTAFFYIGAGISHFFAVNFLVEIVPDILPAKEFIIYLTGVIEIILGIGLLNPKTRELSAWLIFFMLLSYLWAHIEMLIKQDYFTELLHLTEYTETPGIFYYGRIGLQFVMMYWIYAFTEE